MAAQYSFSTEGHSVTRPPMLDNVPFDYWKNRMSRFLRSQDPRLWHMLSTAYITPKITENGMLIEKPFEDWSAVEMELDRLNSVCMNSLYCALKPDDYMKVSTLQTAKEIWDKLVITYEGTNEVRNANINRLVHEFELFRMLPQESITDMHSRFMKIVNQLHSLGRLYSNEDLVHKLLRCLPVEWDPKVTAICESKDFTKYSIDHLLGSLLAHEQGLKARELEEVSSKKKEEKRIVALQVQESDTSSSGYEGENDKEIALLTKRFNKYMKNKRYNRNHSYQVKGTKTSAGKEKKDIECYNCKKMGHYKTECPLLNHDKKDSKEKKNRKRHARKKALWAHSDSDTMTSSSDEEHQASFCLMAHDDIEAEVCFNSDDDDLLSFDELESSYRELFSEYKKTLKKLFKITSKHDKLSSEYDQVCIKLIASEKSVKKDCACSHDLVIKELQRENIILKAKIELLAKRTTAVNDLKYETRMHARKPTYTRSTAYNSYYDRSKSYNNVWCSFCGKSGHNFDRCFARRRSLQSHYAWIPKGRNVTVDSSSSTQSMHNYRRIENMVSYKDTKLGPTYVWVPKLT